jgi:hypothetical protein
MAIKLATKMATNIHAYMFIEVQRYRGTEVHRGTELQMFRECIQVTLEVHKYTYTYS